MENTEQTPKERSLANLKRVPKGDPSPNPNGRPKGAKNRSTVLRELAEMLMEVETLGGLKEKVPADVAINIALMRKAMTGDVAAIKEYQDTLHGKLADKLEANVKQEPTDHDLSVLKHFVKQNPDLLK